MLTSLNNFSKFPERRNRECFAGNGEFFFTFGVWRFLRLDRQRRKAGPLPDATPMPTHNGLRLNDDNRAQHTRPEPIEPDEYEPIGAAKPYSLRG